MPLSAKSASLNQQRLNRFRRARLELLESKRLLAVLSVSNLNDGPVAAAGDLPGSLRQAIFDANALAGEDTIEFAAGLSGTINLLAAQLSITDDLLIVGPGLSNLTIDAGNSSRIFRVNDSDATNQIEVTLSGMTLTNGSSANSGGAIYSKENLSVLYSKVTGNTATNSGGGIYASADAQTSIVSSEVSGNQAGDSGGGAF